MERYERICFIDGMLWSHNCPVLLEKGALLNDTKKGINVLQLKFRNLQKTPIIAVYVIIKQKDIMGHQLGEIEHFYLDLTVKSNQNFGVSDPIELNFKQARLFEYIISAVVFADNSKWESLDIMTPVPTQNDINQFRDLKEQFKIEVHKLNYSVVCVNMPYQANDYWYCTCGCFNLNQSAKCLHCDLEKIKLFQISEIDYLLNQKLLLETENKNIVFEKKSTDIDMMQYKEVPDYLSDKNRKIAIVAVILLFFLFVIAVSFLEKKSNTVETEIESTTHSTEILETTNELLDKSDDDVVIDFFDKVKSDSNQDDISNLLGNDTEIRRNYYTDGNTTIIYNLNYNNTDYKLDGYPGRIECEFDAYNKLVWINWYRFFRNNENDIDLNEDINISTVSYITSFLGEPTSTTSDDDNIYTYWGDYVLRYNYGSMKGLFLEKVFAKE